MLVRQALIGCLLTAFVVTFALVGGGAFYYYILRDAAGLGFFPADIPPIGIHEGEGFFSKRAIPLDGRIDWVTDVVHTELDSVPGLDIGVASAEGILVLDEEFNQKSYSPIIEYVDEIRFVSVPSKGRFYVYNTQSWYEDDAVSLFDLSGAQVWAFENAAGSARMEVGDLDGDGDPEFCIVYSNDDDDDDDDENETLVVQDVDAQELWRKEVQYSWDFSVADVTGDGSDDICLLDSSDLLAIENSPTSSEQIADVPIPEASLITTVDWPGTDLEYILLSLDGRIQIVNASGDTVQTLNAPYLDYPDDVFAVSVTFHANGPKHLAVIANGRYSGEFTQFYIYGPDGELLYYEVLDSYTAALMPLYSESGDGRIIVGGENQLFEYTPAATAPGSVQQQP